MSAAAAAPPLTDMKDAKHDRLSHDGQHSPVGTVDHHHNDARDAEILAGSGAAELDAMAPEDLARFEKKLVRRIDLRLMPMLIIIYVMNYLDRNNAGAARLRGFQSDLRMSDTEFATSLSILYVGYILMQIPSNLMLNYIGRPSLYLPFWMLLWGMLSTLTGVVNNYQGLVAIRFFLGFVEAPFFPGALFLLSRWYTKKELALRTTILYCGSLASNAINGLIAAGILNNLDGRLGHAAWRWLFFIEGAITMFFAICAVFVLPDFPSTTKWLSKAERAMAERRMARDVGEADSDADMTPLQAVKAAVTDPKVWMLTILLTTVVIGLSFNAYFPTLAKTLGYDATPTLLLVAPPWAFAAIVAFANAWHADRTQEKTFHIVGPLGVGMIGLIICMATQVVAARYVGLFLLASSYAGFTVILSWISSTIARPPAKRAVAIALVNCLSQLGNIAGSYVFPSMWGPTYLNSFAILISCFGLGIVMVFGLRFYLVSLNRKLDAGEAHDVARESTAVKQAAALDGVSVDAAIRARRSWRYLV